MSIMKIVQCQGDLFQVIEALSAASGSASLLDSRQQDGNQYCHDGNHHQQLDQGKSTPISGVFLQRQALFHLLQPVTGAAAGDNRNSTPFLENQTPD